MGLKFESVDLHIPKDANIIMGQSHFIKTVEDLYEVAVNTNPGMKFGIGFCEASGPRLVRLDGNDEELIESAKKNCLAVGAGHVFFIVMRDGFPLNILNGVKSCVEVCGIFCATANPTSVIVCRNGSGAGIMGVIDGESPAGVEGETDKKARRDFLRTIAYKR